MPTINVNIDKCDYDDICMYVKFVHNLMNRTGRGRLCFIFVVIIKKNAKQSNIFQCQK